MSSSFYGNIKQNGQSTFIFDAIYSNRYEMEEARKKGDGIFLNRYVLIDYHISKDENGEIIFTDRYTPIENISATSLNQTNILFKYKLNENEPADYYLKNSWRELTVENATFKERYSNLNKDDILYDLLLDEYYIKEDGVWNQVSPIRISQDAIYNLNKESIVTFGQSNEFYRYVPFLWEEKNISNYLIKDNILHPNNRDISIELDENNEISNFYQYKAFSLDEINKDNVRILNSNTLQNQNYQVIYDDISKHYYKYNKETGQWNLIDNTILSYNTNSQLEPHQDQLIYDKISQKYYIYNGTKWDEFSGDNIIHINETSLYDTIGKIVYDIEQQTYRITLDHGESTSINIPTINKIQSIKNYNDFIYDKISGKTFKYDKYNNKFISISGDQIVTIDENSLMLENEDVVYNGLLDTYSTYIATGGNEGSFRELIFSKINQNIVPNPNNNIFTIFKNIDNEIFEWNGYTWDYLEPSTCPFGNSDKTSYTVNLRAIENTVKIVTDPDTNETYEEEITSYANDEQVGQLILYDDISKQYYVMHPFYHEWEPIEIYSIGSSNDLLSGTKQVNNDGAIYGKTNEKYYQLFKRGYDIVSIKTKEEIQTLYENTTPSPRAYIVGDFLNLQDVWKVTKKSDGTFQYTLLDTQEKKDAEQDRAGKWKYDFLFTTQEDVLLKNVLQNKFYKIIIKNDAEKNKIQLQEITVTSVNNLNESNWATGAIIEYNKQYYEYKNKSLLKIDLFEAKNLKNIFEPAKYSILTFSNHEGNKTFYKYNSTTAKWESSQNMVIEKLADNTDLTTINNEDLTATNDGKIIYEYKNSENKYYKQHLYPDFTNPIEIKTYENDEAMLAENSEKNDLFFHYTTDTTLTQCHFYNSQTETIEHNITIYDIDKYGEFVSTPSTEEINTSIIYYFGDSTNESGYYKTIREYRDCLTVGEIDNDQLLTKINSPLPSYIFTDGTIYYKFIGLSNQRWRQLDNETEISQESYADVYGYVDENTNNTSKLLHDNNNNYYWYSLNGLTSIAVNEINIIDYINDKLFYYNSHYFRPYNGKSIKEVFITELEDKIQSYKDYLIYNNLDKNLYFYNNSTEKWENIEDNANVSTLNSIDNINLDLNSYDNQIIFITEENSYFKIINHQLNKIYQMQINNLLNLNEFIVKNLNDNTNIYYRDPSNKNNWIQTELINLNKINGTRMIILPSEENNNNYQFYLFNGSAISNDLICKDIADENELNGKDYIYNALSQKYYERFINSNNETLWRTVDFIQADDSSLTKSENYLYYDVISKNYFKINNNIDKWETVNVINLLSLTPSDQDYIVYDTYTNTYYEYEKNGMENVSENLFNLSTSGIPNNELNFIYDIIANKYYRRAELGKNNKWKEVSFSLTLSSIDDEIPNEHLRDPYIHIYNDKQKIDKIKVRQETAVVNETIYSTYDVYYIKNYYNIGLQLEENNEQYKVLSTIGKYIKDIDNNIYYYTDNIISKENDDEEDNSDFGKDWKLYDLSNSNIIRSFIDQNDIYEHIDEINDYELITDGNNYYTKKENTIFPINIYKLYDKIQKDIYIKVQPNEEYNFLYAYYEVINSKLTLYNYDLENIWNNKVNQGVIYKKEEYTLVLPGEDYNESISYFEIDNNSLKNYRYKESTWENKVNEQQIYKIKDSNIIDDYDNDFNPEINIDELPDNIIFETPIYNDYYYNLSANNFYHRLKNHWTKKNRIVLGNILYENIFLIPKNNNDNNINYFLQDGEIDITKNINDKFYVYYYNNNTFVEIFNVRTILNNNDDILYNSDNEFFMCIENKEFIFYHKEIRLTQINIEDFNEGNINYDNLSIGEIIRVKNLNNQINYYEYISTDNGYDLIPIEGGDIAVAQNDLQSNSAAYRNKKLIINERSNGLITYHIWTNQITKYNSLIIENNADTNILQYQIVFDELALQYYQAVQLNNQYVWYVYDNIEKIQQNYNNTSAILYDEQRDEYLKYNFNLNEWEHYECFKDSVRPENISEYSLIQNNLQSNNNIYIYMGNEVFSHPQTINILDDSFRENIILFKNDLDDRYYIRQEDLSYRFLLNNEIKIFQDKSYETNSELQNLNMEYYLVAQDPLGGITYFKNTPKWELYTNYAIVNNIEQRDNTPAYKRDGQIVYVQNENKYYQCKLRNLKLLNYYQLNEPQEYLLKVDEQLYEYNFALQRWIQINDNDIIKFDKNVLTQASTSNENEKINDIIRNNKILCLNYLNPKYYKYVPNENIKVTIREISREDLNNINSIENIEINDVFKVDLMINNQLVPSYYKMENGALIELIVEDFTDKINILAEPGKIIFNGNDGKYYQYNNSKWNQISLVTTPLNLDETQEYKNNRIIDQKEYGHTYDATVWMKIYSNNNEKYILIGKFNDYTTPTFDYIIDAPYAQTETDSTKQAVQHPEIDYLHSGNLNYRIINPGVWNFTLKNTISDYSERLQHPNQWYEHLSDSDELLLEEVESNNEYPKIKYQEIQVTEESYERNRYYIKNSNNVYVKSSEAFSPTRTYYTITQDINSMIKKKDTKQLSIKLPSLVNGISSIYDALYGVPITENKINGALRPNTSNELEWLLTYTIPKSYEDRDTNVPLSVASGLISIKSFIDNLKAILKSESIISDWNVNGSIGDIGFIANKPNIVTEKTINKLWQQL